MSFFEQNTTWDSVSESHAIPFSLKSLVISFENLGAITHSEVFIECVEDDIQVSGEDSQGVFQHYVDAGQYLKGDLIKSPSLHVINTTGNVRIINNSGAAITIPRGNAGSPDRPDQGDFTILSTNKKYRLRCFASQSKLPILPARQSFWDEQKTVAANITSQRRIEIPHTLGVVPAIVELNFVFVKNVHGYLIGDVLPLKFIGGRQLKSSANLDETVWTTSADSNSVYFGMSNTNVLMIPRRDSTHEIFNLFSNSVAQIQVCIRRDYPNPYGVDFITRYLNRESQIDSDQIQYYPGSGEVLDSDLIIENLKTHTNTGFSPGTYIYYNQCGGTCTGAGTNVNLDYSDQSSFIWHDHSLSSRDIHNQRLIRTGNNPELLPPSGGSSDHDNKLSLQASPNTKMGGMCFYDWVRDRVINIWNDSAGDWTAKHRWQYEGGAPSYDADTGWLSLEQYGMSMPKLNMNMSEFWYQQGSPSKVDIFLRLPQDLFAGMRLGATWSMANLKGGALAYSKDPVTTVGNTWAIHYNKVSLNAANIATPLSNSVTVPTIPNWHGTGTKDSSGNSFDSAIGAMQVRFCAHK